MTIRSYSQALTFLYERLPMFSRIGKAALKPNLDNIRALCDVLGNPQDKYKTIHIAGTNGKGTVSHLIAGIMTSQGHKVGLHTSPHYIDFRERIKVDGDLAPKSFVVEFLNTYIQQIEEIKPSYFELSVAMAFEYFAREKVDYAVIEVGLGGRLDSTNIINPILSVITNISLDHTDLLGDTIEQIAFEKAGIIKPKTPVIIGEYQEETWHVFKAKADQEGAPIILASDVVRILKTSESSTGSIFEWVDQDLTFEIDIKGKYNEINVVTAIAVWTQLFGRIEYKVAFTQYMKIFRTLMMYMGRWQVLQESPLVLVDSAHNEGGIQFLIDYIKSESFSKVHFVLGMVSDKTREKILEMLPGNASYYFVKANLPRGLEAESLRKEAELHGKQGKSYSTVRRGLSAALRKAKKEDLVVVGGSIFVVAEVLQAFLKKQRT